MTHRKLPDDGHLIELIRSGLTRTDVARRYGCTRQSVAERLKKAGMPPVKVQAYREWIPWRVKVVHNDNKIVRRLRKYARYRLGDTSLSDAELARTHRWVTWLVASNLVVDYHPEKGFFYTDRLPTEDPRAIVRRPA